MENRTSEKAKMQKPNGKSKIRILKRESMVVHGKSSQSRSCKYALDI